MNAQGHGFLGAAGRRNRHVSRGAGAALQFLGQGLKVFPCQLDLFLETFARFRLLLAQVLACGRQALPAAWRGSSRIRHNASFGMTEGPVIIGHGGAMANLAGPREVWSQSRDNWSSVPRAGELVGPLGFEPRTKRL